MCSVIPKPKQPVLEKFFFFSSNSLTFRAKPKRSSALTPLTYECDNCQLTEGHRAAELAYGDMDSDLLVSPDAERSDSVSG